MYCVSLYVCVPVNTDTAAYCFMFLLYSLSRYECLAVQYDCFSSQSVESRALNNYLTLSRQSVECVYGFSNFSILNVCRKHVALVLFLLGTKINFPHATTVYRPTMYPVFDKDTNPSNLSPNCVHEDMCSTYMLPVTYLL